ncbi:MAG TPA: antibiotic biosynthesis monooxygenase [Solirubrobacteraceae bacterium]|nr:antibiotic biosynthesis monooxygenase [Solirubrobacteraceae bacterium]
MSKVARFAKSKAKPGRGDELAAKLLEAAAALESFPGCERYVVCRDPQDPDTVWVDELWRSMDELQASLKLDGVPEKIQEVLPLIDRESMASFDLEPVGGKGLVDPGEGVPPYTKVALDQVEDLAPKFGFGELGEARFANEDLALQATGVAFHHVRPGKRQAFGHRHVAAEEVYVVVRGAGRVKLDDEVVELAERDAIRVAPAVARAFEASDAGMELLAVGPRHKGDGEMLMGWWI